MHGLCATPSPFSNCSVNSGPFLFFRLVACRSLSQQPTGVSCRGTTTCRTRHYWPKFTCAGAQRRNIRKLEGTKVRNNSDKVLRRLSMDVIPGGGGNLCWEFLVAFELHRRRIAKKKHALMCATTSCVFNPGTVIADRAAGLYE